MNVYEVEYSRQYQQKKVSNKRWEPKDWISEGPVCVLTNGDVTDAIKKVERWVRKEKDVEFESDNDLHVERTTGVKIMKVELLHKIDIR